MKTKKKKGFHQKWTLFSPNLNEDQEKKVFTKNGTPFFPDFKRTPTLRCTPESNCWGKCRSRPYSSYCGDTVKLLKDISPHTPGFRHPCFCPARLMTLGCNEAKVIVVDYIEMTYGWYYDVRCCENHLLENIENFSSYFGRTKCVILTIELVEKYCFVLVGNMHKKLMWNLEWINKFFLTAKNKL